MSSSNATANFVAANVAFATALASAFPVQAQTGTSSDVVLDPVVVVATRQETRVSELLSDTSVIDREAIQQAGPSVTLGELLARLPGVELSRVGSRGASETVFIRGTNSGHALILVDGMRIGSATLGQADLSNLSPQQVERIEVLRGPASAVYGSDAIGGVINITTVGSSRGVSAEVGVGSHGAYAASIGGGGRVGDLSFQLRVLERGERGVNMIPSPASVGYNSDRDGYWRRGLNAAADYKVSPDTSIGVRHFYTEGVSKLDSSWPASSDDHQTRNRLNSSSIQLDQRLAAFWQSRLQFARSTDSSTTTPSNTIGQVSDEFRTSRDQYLWQNDLDLPLGKGLVLFERLEEHVRSTSTFDRTKRDINSIALGWNGQYEAHRWQINARQDRNSQYGSQNTHTLGYGYQIHPQWRIAASAGRAFKAPSFNDLYYPNTPFSGVGNPDLRPESSRSKEVSLHYETKISQTALTVFRNDIRDLISWEETAPGSWFYSPFNVGRARIDGWSLSESLRLGNWALGAVFNEQDAIDVDSGLRLNRRAKRFGTLSADWQRAAWSAGAELRLSGDRYDDTANLRRLGGYGVLNLRASYAIDSRWTVFARMDNVFDRDYETSRTTTTGYATLGRTLFAGVRLKLD